MLRFQYIPLVGVTFSYHITRLFGIKVGQEPSLILGWQSLFEQYWQESNVWHENIHTMSNHQMNWYKAKNRKQTSLSLNTISLLFTLFTVKLLSSITKKYLSTFWDDDFLSKNFASLMICVLCWMTIIVLQLNVFYRLELIQVWRKWNYYIFLPVRLTIIAISIEVNLPTIFPQYQTKWQTVQHKSIKISTYDNQTSSPYFHPVNSGSTDVTQILSVTLL